MDEDGRGGTHEPFRCVNGSTVLSSIVCGEKAREEQVAMVVGKPMLDGEEKRVKNL